MKPSLPATRATRLLSGMGIVLCLSAGPDIVRAQTSDPLKLSISVNESKQPLEKILKNIAANAQVKFAYDVNEIRKYTITLREKKELTIDELLKKVLQQTGLVYESHANTIVIYPKDGTPVSGTSLNAGNTVQFAGYVVQKKTFAGTVSDEKGPLQNASVYIKGTTHGTVTDANGNFSIQSDDDVVTVVVSLIGYHTKEMVLKQGEDNHIVLKQESTTLDSVVVVGYGTQKRLNITGAIAEAKLDHLSSRSVGSVAEALQGKAPGVVVQDEGGDPTSQPRINIRGIGGINGESVLYVVDGSIFNGTPALNPNEIESISVLKDAAAAIYGARASGGVVLITTKKGKSGTASVTLDAKFGMQHAWRKLQALNAKEFADVENQAADNAGKPRLDAFNATVYPDGQITRTNWIDDIFRTGHIQDYNIGISSGNDKSRYFMGFGYRKNEGILLNTYADRYSFRLNSDHQVKPWLKLGENLSFSRTNGNYNVSTTNDAYTGAILSAIYYPPNVAPYNPDGSFAGLPAQYAGAYGDVINPVAYLLRKDDKNPINTLVANPYAEIRLLRGLVFRSNFAYTLNFSTEKEFQPRILEIGKIFDFNKLSQNIKSGTNILAEQTLSYNRSFGLHNLTALAGYAYQQDEVNNLKVYVQNFADESQSYRYLQNGNDLFKPYSDRIRWGLISYFGRINYDYDSRYIISLLGRRDGSSLVSKDHRYENYYSVSGGWVVNREHFLSGAKWLNNLKLRASYGLIGNLGSIPATAVSPLLDPVQVYMGQTPTMLTGYVANTLANPNLKWANSRQSNFGLDITVLKNRLSLMADYYIKNTENMLMLASTPSTTGATNGQYVNGGTARDQGIELGLNYNDHVGKDFQYSINASVTTINNKLISLPGGNKSMSTSNINVRSTLTPLAVQVGQPLYSYYVIKTAGLFQSQDEVNNYKNKNGQLIQPNAKPGDMRFVDANGDGKIDNNDRVIVGSAYPKFNYSFSFNASYKGFDINIFAQGVSGNKLFNALKYTAMNPSIGTNYNMLKGILNAWTPTNTNTNIPRVSSSDANGNYGNTSDWYVENGSYLRIKNVILGYTLPKQLTDKAGLNTIRVYVTANNLLTFTGYKGFDPEVGMDNYGIDLARYPQARSFMLGLNVNF